VIGNAVKVMRILTGDEVEILAEDDGKDPAAKALNLMQPSLTWLLRHRNLGAEGITARGLNDPIPHHVRTSAEPYDTANHVAALAGLAHEKADRPIALF
jgi:hypothetical protein